MTRLEKQKELERHRTLLLATLDYHLDHYTGSIVFDQWDPAAEYYLQQKQQTEKYFQQRRLDRLQQKLERLTEHLSTRADLNFGSFIKERTGHDIDIFEDMRVYVASIVARGVIATKEEALKIGEILWVYQQVPTEEIKVDSLRKLLVGFYEPANLNKQLSKPGLPIMPVVINVGVFEPNSPDGKRKVVVESSGTGNYALTYVVIHLQGASGSIYSVRGMNLPVRTYWKDNNTVVIETKKEFLVSTQHRQVRSFQDVIKIEYSEG